MGPGRLETRRRLGAQAAVGQRRAGLSVCAHRRQGSSVPGHGEFRRHPALQPVAPLRPGRVAAAEPLAGRPWQRRGLAHGRPWPVARRDQATAGSPLWPRL
ncbi:hypothetical protein G6F68_015631 [Rhizopus microsporus]|nr:hypothetical protein G6F68_015631 [Rhizopus microsporus]